MNYASVDDLEKALGTPYRSIYKDDTASANADLVSAAAVVDGYLAKRYCVPVTEPGAMPILKEWCVAIAMELAYGRAGGSTIPEKTKDRAKRAYDQLRDAAKGTLQVPAAPAENTENSIGGAVAIECDEPVFTRDKMRGY